ncbi:putative signal transducing protein [Sphingobacterium spiritivorum]|uniref:putative signal transducing protein n=1 Tax=Sphingobacterium spiritivorum TaxID=258 RepID=UPI003DA5F209
MEKDWVKIKTYTNAIQSEIVKQMLLENEVNAVVLNKQDSSYLFGKIELYVNVNDVDKANALIDELNPEEN